METKYSFDVPTNDWEFQKTPSRAECPIAV